MGLFSRSTEPDGKLAGIAKYQYVFDAEKIGRVFDRIEHDIETCLSMKATIDEAGYYDDSDMIEAYIIVNLVAEDLRSGVYAAAVYGVTTTCDKIAKERDQRCHVSRNEARQANTTVHHIASAHGFDTYLGCSAMWADGGVWEFSRSAQSQAVYNERIRALTLIQADIETNQELLKTRLSEAAQQIAHVTETIGKLHRLIHEDRDPLLLQQRNRGSSLHESVEF